MVATAAPTSPNPAHDRLATLRAYLEADPGNPALIEETASVAFEVDDLDLAETLIAQRAEQGSLSDGLQNLSALIALRRGRFSEACSAFEALLAATPNDLDLSANLTWARAGMGDHAAVLALTTDALLTAHPAVAVLKLRTLHAIGQLTDALSFAGIWGARADSTFLGAASQVALDAEDRDLARRYAEGGSSSHEGAAALGMLAFEDGDVATAQRDFSAALRIYPQSARALLGQGLVMMSFGQPSEAAPYLDQAATLFRSHLGSWVAAGWAHFAAGEVALSRERFETALAIDDTFAETHGALAVLDVLEGSIERAKREVEVAQRLDRNCFSAALAQTLLLEKAGRGALAEKVRSKALTTVVTEDGRTLGQMMATLASR